jgi:hypothetical protein
MRTEMYKNAEQRMGVHHCLVGAPNPLCSAGEVISAARSPNLALVVGNQFRL